VEFYQFQFGFRKGYSTAQQILRLTEWTTRAFNFKKATGAVFPDVEKAFDRVWQGGLLCQLHALEIPRRLQEVLKSYLTGRAFNLREGAALSSPRSLTAGVPQGSLLSPLLSRSMRTIFLLLSTLTHGRPFRPVLRDNLFFVQLTRFTMSALTILS
jgi:hypothetical protein